MGLYLIHLRINVIFCISNKPSEGCSRNAPCSLQQSNQSVFDIWLSPPSVSHSFFVPGANKGRVVISKFAGEVFDATKWVCIVDDWGFQILRLWGSQFNNGWGCTSINCVALLAEWMPVEVRWYGITPKQDLSPRTCSRELQHLLCFTFIAAPPVFSDNGSNAVMKRELGFLQIDFFFLMGFDQRQVEHIQEPRCIFQWVSPQFLRFIWSSTQSCLLLITISHHEVAEREYTKKIRKPRKNTVVLTSFCSAIWVWNVAWSISDWKAFRWHSPYVLTVRHWRMACLPSNPRYTKGFARPMIFKISLHVCRWQPSNFRRAEAGWAQLTGSAAASNRCPLNFQECTSTIPMFSFSLEPFQFEHQCRHHFDHFSERITELWSWIKHFDEYLLGPTRTAHTFKKMLNCLKLHPRSLAWCIISTQKSKVNLAVAIPAHRTHLTPLSPFN